MYVAASEKVECVWRGVCLLLSEAKKALPDEYDRRIASED